MRGRLKPAPVRMATGMATGMAAGMATGMAAARAAGRAGATLQLVSASSMLRVTSVTPCSLR